MATGGDRSIEVRRQATCTGCKGNGADPVRGRQDCTECEGTGKAVGRRLFRSQCPHCNGVGQVIVKKCADCTGLGRTESVETLNVRIPKGVATGQKLKLRGKGNDARSGGESGDLFVIINVAEHALFQRRGSDLHCVVPIRFSSAALGANIAVPTLGKQSTIKVPPGTESGRVLRLSGRGLPTMKGGRTGDLHFELQVETPTSLTQAQRKAVEALDGALDNNAHPRHAAFVENMKERP